MTTQDLSSRFESVWFVEGTYAPDAAETRAPVRPAHVENLVRMMESGTLVFVGSFPDMTASVMVVRAGSEREALDLFRDDVYLRNGVWVEIRARPFMRLLG